MSQQQNVSQSNGTSSHEPSKQFTQSKPIYETVLPNARGSNSANYIPTRIYESYRQHNQSNISKASRKSNINNQEISAFQKLSQLSQRLKNIHHFYKLRIDEEKTKNAQRNEVFMTIVQQLQKSHNDKIAAIQREIQTAEDQKKQVSYVDDKMSEIKGSIDQILKQSATYKQSNEKLEKEIMHKEQALREKERNLQRLKKEEIDFRNQLQDFMKLNLKENRKQREMLEMIDNVIGSRGISN